jgi:hypothetical protein
MKPCEIEKLSHPLDHRTFVDRSGHGHVSASPKAQETFLAQDAQGTKDRVGVDAKHRR